MQQAGQALVSYGDSDSDGPEERPGARSGPATTTITGDANQRPTSASKRIRLAQNASEVVSDPVASPSTIEEPQQPIAGPSRPSAVESDPNFPLARFGLRPPNPEARCDPALEAKLAHFQQLSSQGLSFNASLMRNKAFRNPHILSKLVDFVSVDESGSNLGDAAWDRQAMMRDGNATLLASRQKRKEDERTLAQGHNKRSNINFAPPAPSPTAPRDRPDRERHSSASRWDRDDHRERGRRRSRSPPRRR